MTVATMAGKPEQWFIHPDLQLRGDENVISVTSEAGAYPGAVVAGATNFGRLIPSQSGDLSSSAVPVDYRLVDAGGVGRAQFIWKESSGSNWYGVDDVRRWWGYHAPADGTPGSDNCAAAFASSYRRIVMFHAASGSTTGRIKYRDIDTSRYDDWTTATFTLDRAAQTGEHGARMIELPDGRLMLVLRVADGNGTDFDVYHSGDGGTTWTRVSEGIIDAFVSGSVTHDLDTQFKLARAGEHIRLCWLNNGATLKTLLSTDRGISWQLLTDGTMTFFDNGDTDDMFAWDIAGVSDAGEFLLTNASTSTGLQHWSSVGANAWSIITAGSDTLPAEIKCIVLVRTPEYLYEYVMYADSAAASVATDGWALRRAHPQKYIDFTNSSGIGWESIDAANTYDAGIAYYPSRMSAVWAGSYVCLLGARKSEAAGTDIDRPLAWYHGGWTQRSIYRARPTKSLSDMGQSFASRFWSTECGEPTDATGTPWTSTVVAGGASAFTTDHVQFTSALVGDAKYFVRTVGAAAGPSWGIEYGAVFGWMVRVDTGDSTTAFDNAAVRIIGENQADTLKLDLSVRMADAVVLYDNNAGATLDTVAVNTRTGSAGAFFEVRLWMRQDTGPVYNAQLAVLDTGTGVWTVGAVCALTSAAAAGNNQIRWGHLGCNTAGMDSWWREVWIIEGGTQEFSASQEDFVNPTSLVGAVTSGTPTYVEHGLQVAWGGAGGAIGDTFNGEVLHTYPVENVVVDSPRICWRSTSLSAQTIILDAGANRRFVCNAIAAFGLNNRQVLIDFDSATTFASPTATTTLDSTVFGTAVLPFAVGSTAGTALLYTSTTGTAGAKVIDGELAGKYVRVTTGGAAGATWRVTRHDPGGFLHFDDEGTSLSAQGLTAGASFVVFGDRAVVELTAPVERYMRIRLTETDIAEGYHQIGTLVVGRRVNLDVPLDWAHTDNEQPNITNFRTRGGIAWAYQEGPPQRTLTARMVGDASRRMREKLRFLARQTGYETKPTAWIINDDSANESLWLARMVSGSQMDQASWFPDAFDLLRNAGDQSITLVEDV